MRNSYTFDRRFLIGLARCIVLLLLAIALPFQAGFADNVYTWTDSKGVAHYGTKPPKNGESARPVSETTISRYSSDKMTKGFRAAAKRSDVSAKKESSLIRSANNPDSGKNTGISKLPNLEYDEPVTVVGDDGNVSALSVKLRNSGGSDALDVVVQFVFDQGSLITGVGPTKIQPAEEVVFSVPDNALPIVLGDGAKGAEPKPEVLISYN